LRTIAAKPTVFSYGTVETNKGLAVQSPDGEMGIMTSFAALTKNVPEPFKKEFNGGAGMHIHDKFVVVDFNAANPTVFTGSSNLAAGGEQANGDSLAMIEDAAVANMFAIEAVALFDHYHFRKAMQEVKVSEPPLTLWYPGKPNAPDPWWKAYYDPKRIQMRDRYLFADLPLPAGLASTKNVDWSAVDAEDAQKKTKPGGAGKASAKKSSPAKPAARKPSARKPPARKGSADRPKKSAVKQRGVKKAAASKANARKTRKTSAGKKAVKVPARKRAAASKKRTARKTKARTTRGASKSARKGRR
jgi:hypothetical protein